MERWIQSYLQAKMGKYDIVFPVTIQCPIVLLWLFLIISYIGKKKPILNDPCWVNLKLCVDINVCSDASKPCVTTNPSTLRCFWSLYLMQHFRFVQWYCVITDKEWLFSKVIFLLIFFSTLDDILKFQHTTNIFNPIARLIWYVLYVAKFWSFRTLFRHLLIKYE